MFDMNGQICTMSSEFESGTARGFGDLVGIQSSHDPWWHPFNSMLNVL